MADLVDKLHRAHVEKPHICQAHIRNDRQRDEGERDERIAFGMDAECGCRVQQLPLVLENDFQRRVAHETRNGKDEPCLDFATTHNDISAAALFEHVNRLQHVRVIVADDHEVVRIVTHGGSDCAVLDIKPAQNTQTDPSGGVMPL